MLKSAIIATISISSLLSITSIADAKSIDNKSTHHSANQTTLNLTTKQPSSNINTVPVSDLRDIHKAINNFYKSENERNDPSGKLVNDGWGCPFHEITGLQLISFSNTEALVNINMITHGYQLRLINKNPVKFVLQKRTGAIVGSRNIKLDKVKGKWKVNH